MKYKNYEEVLKAKDYISAMKEYLKDKGMTLAEFSATEESRLAGMRAAKFRFSGPMNYTSVDPNKK